ncbi:WXG100 family type VII secretion target [Nocardia sp. alder85J]|uniref:WXG100 family type VII secretion target n=1 Tax=Nocardia sp. alder85J TaxID=2862949 RepID=UPI001CD669B6|nr:type VII secretion target [Nocardia sp. alder85J]MCX4096657.1 WXG100 family type VII secretion target [Nocardia sp. alder85J]
MAADGGYGAGGQSLSAVPEEVSGLGRYVYAQAQTLQNALNATDKDVAGLTASNWTGPTASVFTEGWSECCTSGKQIFETLIELAGKLGITASNYSELASRTTGAVSSLNL